MKTVILITSIAAGLALTACNFDEPEGIALPNCPGTNFAKQALVFETVAICATSGVSDAKLAHAANVTAEWLDNDSDGAADDPRVIAALGSKQPFVIMTKNGITDGMIEGLLPALETRVGQDLGAGETNPGLNRRDASQEEIHHIILNAGWKVAFPDVFLDQPGSALYAQWELAEANGHYDYDDPTCDASCKVTEFFYLATAAYLGADSDLKSDEMRLKTRSALAQALPQTVALMQSADYVYPLNHWPSGAYPHQTNIALYP